MYVSVIHHVSDPKGFMKPRTSDGSGFADAFSLPIHAATRAHGVGICIWEGASVDAVRTLVESVVGPFRQNAYLEMSVDGLS